MSIKYGSIIIFVLLLVFMGGVYAGDVNQTSDDVLTSDASDELSIDLQEDNDDEVISSGDASDDDVVEVSNDEVLGDENSGNWTELRQVFRTDDEYINLTKDYHFETVWLGPNTVGDRVINFYNKNITVDGRGHTIDFTTDRNNTSAGGRFELSNCDGMVFKNIKFINIEFMNHKSNHTTFINCTFHDFDMFVFQCSDGINIENCTFECSEGKSGGVTFGLKGWYDGAHDILGGNNNVISNCRFINMKSVYGRSLGCGGALLFAGGNNTVVNSTFINCSITSTTADDKESWINTDPSLWLRTGGGAISFAGGGNRIIGCNFTNSWSKVTGGAIYFAQGNNTITDSIFTLDENMPEYTKNVTSKTGAVFFDGTDGNSIDNTVFSNFGNTESVIYSEGSLNITDSTFTNNGAASVDLKGSDNYISNSVFINNSAENGGALSIVNTTVTNCNFTNNRANNSGGAIYSKGNNVIDNCNFVNNSAENGGAIACIDSEGSTIDNSDFINNSAENAGGAAYLSSTASSNIYNSYFEGNSANTGTAIFVGDNKNSEAIKNSTFAVAKEKCDVNIIINIADSLIKVQFLPPDGYIYGVNIINSEVEEDNLSYIVNGDKFATEDPQIGKPLLNKNITIELYDENMVLLSNDTLKTDDAGWVSLRADKLFDDERPAKYIKAYHQEDIYFYYAEDEAEAVVGDFDKLQFLVNSAGENGIVSLNRNYTYDMDLDTITEGVVVRYNNVTINGNGYAINALNQSRIFKILGNGSKLTNITFVNSINGAVRYEEVSDAVIDYSKFVDNQGMEGTIYFIGGNLTLSNSELINSTTSHPIYKDYFEDIESHEGTGLLYVGSYGTLTISNTKFKNSQFGDYGINVANANNVILDNLEFEDNCAYYEYYYTKRTGSYPKYVYQPIKELYEGYYGNLVSISAGNVEISGIKSNNDTVNSLISILAYNSTVKNVNVTNSALSSALIVKSNSTVDGIEVENITSSFDKQVWNYYTGDYTQSTVNSYERYIIHVNNVEIETDPETGDTTFDLHSAATVRNVNIKDISALYDNAILAYSANLVMDNINLSNYNMSYSLIGAEANNANVSNVNVVDSQSVIESIAYFTNHGNLSLRNVNLKNFQMIRGGDLISIYGHDLNSTVLIDSMVFENITPSGYNNTWSSGWSYNYYGFTAISCSDYDADVSVSNILVDDCFIANALFIQSDSLNVSDVAVVNSSVSDNDNIFYLVTVDNMTLESILVDNSKVEPYVYKYYSSYYDRYYWNDNLPNAGSGITAYSQQGTVSLNNINLTNLESAITNLVNIVAYSDVLLKDVNLENISEPKVQRALKMKGDEFYYEYFSGVSPNSILISSSNGTVKLDKVSFDEISSGQYGQYYMNVSGANVTVDDLSINNAAIGGFSTDNSIIINAKDYLTVNNFVFNNITSLNAFNHTYYNSTFNMDVYEYYRTVGSAGMFMKAGKNVTVSNISITNTAGGLERGSLYLYGDNVVLTNVLIDNLNTSDSLYMYFNEETRTYIGDSSKGLVYSERIETDQETGDSSVVEEYVISNRYDYSSPGICIEANSTIVDNVTVTNCLYAAEMGTEMILMDLYIESNATVSNINVENITEKPSFIYEFDEQTKSSKLYSYSGEINPHISIYAGKKLGLYNLTVNAVESSGMYEFLDICGNDGIIENVSITNSAIGSSDEAIEIEMNGNLYIQNFNVDNIYGALLRNETQTVDYYMYLWGNYVYAYSQSYYEVESEAQFSIYMDAVNLELFDMNVTNIFSGSYESTLIIYAANYTRIDNLLIENISSFDMYYEYFEPYAMKYVTDYMGSESNAGLSVNNYGGFEGNAVLSNIKLNNITTSEYLFAVYDANITMENVTISNITQKPMVYYSHDENYDQYIEGIYYESLYDLIRVYADTGLDNSDNVNIANWTVDNIPCGESSIVVMGRNNVSISNSIFKNMISRHASYMHDEDLGELVLYEYNNQGIGLLVGGTDVTVMDTLFENITLGSGPSRGGEDVMGRSLVIYQTYSNASALIDNCSFIDIHSVMGNVTYYGSESEIYESKGSAVNIVGAASADIIDSRFINCSADYGGAIYIAEPLNITNSTFETNEAVYGGAIYLSDAANGVNIRDSTFIKNLAAINGGAIYLFEASGDMNTIENSTFIGNHAVHDGGAFFYNNTQNALFFDDYQWFNRTAMFSDGLLNYAQPKTQISVSSFENNTDHELKIIANDVTAGMNQTVVIILPIDCDGEVTVNITNEDGIFMYDLNGNEIKNMNYTLVNGTVSIPLGILGDGKYNVSAYHDNYNSQYSDYHNYAYHYNSTVFAVYGNFLNVTAISGFVDENVTIIAELDNRTTGTVDITISNATHNLTFSDVPIVNGTVNYNVTDLWAGQYNVTVAYNGNQYAGVISNTTNFTLSQRESKVNASVEGNVYGNTTRIIVDVPENQTGIVTVVINNQTYTKEVINGTAEFEIENLTAGEWKANITFNENRIYKANNTIFAFNVTKANLTANATINNATAGDITINDNASFIIDVPDDFNGNVTISIGDKTYYDGPVGEVLSISTLPAGDYTANVGFYGDDNYNDANVDVEFTVKAAEPQMNVTITNTTYGINATATVSVSGNASGIVNITVDGKIYTGNVVNGSATVQLDNLTAGMKEAEVQFISSDKNYLNTTAATIFTVAKANSTLIISNATYDVVVSLCENATGNVTVYVNGEKFVKEIDNGRVVIENILKPGENSVVAIYDDDNFNKVDNSTTIVVPVDGIVKANASLVISNESSSIVVSVPVNATGNVTVYVNGEKFVREIKDGKVVVEDILKPGENSVVASYGGNMFFNGADNSTVITVGEPVKANASLVISNESSSVVVSVPVNATGNITVYVNGEKFVREIKDGKVVVEDILKPGENSVVASYEGDRLFNRAENSTTITVPGEDTYAPANPFNITVVDLIAKEGRAIINVTGDSEGNVTVIVDNGEKITQPMSDGFSVFNLTGLSRDKHNITVICPDGSVSQIALDGKINGTPLDITTIKAENMKRGYNSPYDYQAVFLDKEGNALVNTVVKYIVNGKEYNITTDKEGVAQLTGSRLAVGKYNITSVNTVTGENITKQVQIVKRIIENKDLTIDYTQKASFTVKVIGDDGNIAPKGEIISIYVNGVYYVCKVDSKGYASLNIRLLPKTYKMVAEYKGFKTTNKLVVKQILKVVKKTTTIKKSTKSFKLKATLKYSNGKAITGKKITFTINGKVFSAKTDKKGVATVTVKQNFIKTLKAGKKYTVKVTYPVKQKAGKSSITIIDQVKCYLKVNK